MSQAMLQSSKSHVKKVTSQVWDVVIVGGGHNGLVAASYLAKQGKQVCVLERRPIVGGAAVTEEIIPGFHFSRASYVFSLFRPKIIQELELEKHGLKLYPRNPSSFTPTLNGPSLLLGSDAAFNRKQIAQFSEADADAFPRYNQLLDKLVSCFVPMLDETPPDSKIIFSKNHQWRARIDSLFSFMKMAYRVGRLGKDITTFIEFMTAPASKILNRWFESDILKATLATDAIIGAMVAPSTPGSAYVLFHHVMGEVNGQKGSWAHVHGGMGAVSQALVRSATSKGVTILTDAQVDSITVEKSGSNVSATGVNLKDGSQIKSKCVMSNASPSHTFLELLDPEVIPRDYRQHFEKVWSCESASTKINVALDQLPNFTCLPNATTDGTAMPHHRGTIHFEDRMEQIEEAFLDVQQGLPSKRPVIEMNIPTSLDNSIAPAGKHIALLFVQYTPYKPKDGEWNDDKKKKFADQVFSVIEEYAPGFKASIVGYDMLTPPDLERIFSLPKGNIFHGAMGLDQLLWLRPFGGYSNYRTPIKGLYLCSAGTHPGGGVMGSPGRNAALACLNDMK